MKGSPRTLFRRATALAALILLLAGCAASPQTPIAPSLTPRPQGTPASPSSPMPGSLPTISPGTQLAGEEEWIEYEQPEDGFALSLPRSWRKVDPDSATLPTALSAPDLPEQRLVSLPADPDIHFLAFDPSSERAGAGYMTNLNVLHRRLSTPMPLTQFVEGNVRELEKVAEVSRPVQVEAVQLPAGSARCLRYRFSPGDGEGALSLIQYLLVRGQHSYVLTFATPPTLAGQYEPTFIRISESLRWLGG